MTMKSALFGALCGILAVFSPTVAGQDFPSKPVRIIVPFPPGAGPDVVSRAVSQQLTARWKQQIIVDNRPGAGGNIGTELAAKAAPDGHTLLLASNHVTINPSLFKELHYDPVRDLAAVTLATATPNILVVQPSLPTVAEAGLRDYEIVSWQGLFAPAGTPTAVVRKIYSAMAAALNAPEIKAALLVQGLETVASTPEAFSKYVGKDIAKWAKVVRDAKMRVD